MPKVQAKVIRKAAVSYLGAHVAYRDAKRLLKHGLAAATMKAFGTLEAEPVNLGEAIELVAAKEAFDLIELYEQNPDKYPEGRTAESALKDGLRRARGRYQGNKCSLCKGIGLACAKRHAHGRSCA